jgi:hypothetical protein
MTLQEEKQTEQGTEVSSQLHVQYSRDKLTNQRLSCSPFGA